MGFYPVSVIAKTSQFLTHALFGQLDTGYIIQWRHDYYYHFLTSLRMRRSTDSLIVTSFSDAMLIIFHFLTSLRMRRSTDSLIVTSFSDVMLIIFHFLTSLRMRRSTDSLIVTSFSDAMLIIFHFLTSLRMRRSTDSFIVTSLSDVMLIIFHFLTSLRMHRSTGRTCSDSWGWTIARRWSTFATSANHAVRMQVSSFFAVFVFFLKVFLIS